MTSEYSIEQALCALCKAYPGVPVALGTQQGRPWCRNRPEMALTMSGWDGVLVIEQKGER